MRFGLYYSGGLDWTFNDHPIGTFGDLLAAEPRGEYLAYAEAQVRELISRYEPSVLWNDIAWPAGAGGLAKLLADYYRQVPEGVVNDRFMPWSPALAAASTRAGRHLLDRFVARAAAADRGVVPPRPPMYDVRTPEYTVFHTIQSEPWECVRGMDHGFGYNRRSTEEDYLGREELVWSLVDIASKGGNLLLNVGPRGEDASIPPPQVARLDWLAEFTASTGTALYGSRPWVTPGGSGRGCDVRYTARDQEIFAFVRPAPGHGDEVMEAFLPGLRAGPTARAHSASGVQQLHEDHPGGLSVKLEEPATRARPAFLALQGVMARRQPET
jgi:alpha-L-fucosidase